MPKRQQPEPSQSPLQEQQQQEDEAQQEQQDAQQQQEGQAQAGPLTEYNPEDWFVPLAPPFKRRPFSADGKKRQWKRLKQLLAAEDYSQLPASVPTFVNAEAPPSVYPPKKYCDITGFEAPYADPKTKLRYASADLFGVVRSLPPDAVQARLAIRGAEVILK